METPTLIAIISGIILLLLGVSLALYLVISSGSSGDEGSGNGGGDKGDSKKPGLPRNFTYGYEKPPGLKR